MLRVAFCFTYDFMFSPTYTGLSEHLRQHATHVAAPRASGQIPGHLLAPIHLALTTMQQHISISMRGAL